MDRDMIGMGEGEKRVFNVLRENSVLVWTVATFVVRRIIYT